MSEPSSPLKVGVLLDAIAASRQAHETSRRLYEDQLSPDFSPLQFLWLDELMWSKLIGWLLNPRGTHGQKGRFLHLFMRHVCHSDRIWSDEECDKATLTIEHSFEGGRIDILVHCSDRFLIIENKPYAGDQNNQLYRYFRYAEERSRESTIVYLTSGGQEPSSDSLCADEREAGLADGALILQSYRGLALSSGVENTSWLDACRLACRSPRVAAFIEEIQTQINAEFSGVRNMSESDALTDLMIKTPDAIRSSFQVSGSFLLMKEKLVHKLVEQLIIPSGVYLMTPIVQDGGFLLRFDVDQNIPYVVAFNVYTPTAIGLYRRDGKDSKDPDAIALGKCLFNDLKSLGKSENWGGDKWAWVTKPDEDSELCSLPSDFWSNPEPWIQIADYDRSDHSPENDVAAKIIAAVLKIRDTLAEAQTRRVNPYSGIGQ